MSRVRYRVVNGNIVEVNESAPVAQRVNIISDNLPSTICPADGKRYDSKSKYYGAVKAAGCEIIGGGSVPDVKPQYNDMGLKADIAAAYNSLRGL